MKETWGLERWPVPLSFLCQRILVKVYQTISSLQDAWLLKQALKPDTKMIYRRYSNLESWNQTCLPMS